MEIDFYEEHFRVTDCEADCMRRMTLGAILRRTQQIATDHCDQLGLDAPLYARTHTAFLMAKLALESYVPLRIGDEVRMVTKPSAPQRAVYHRVTDFFLPDGVLACTVDSRWVLVDTQTKRILRQPPEELHMPFGRAPEKELDVSLRKAPAQAVGQERATYTRCDVNRHLNNTHYADIVCDYLPAEDLVANPIRRMAIVYHNEVPMGAAFTLHRARLTEGDWYFLGEGEKKHFEAQVTFDGAQN